MANASFRTASMSAACGAALLAAVPLAAAADLPIVKVPPRIADSGNPFWAEIEYLAWTVKGDRLPPLVTTSPAGTPLLQAGVLGLPTTSVLFGDSAVNGGWRSGGRVRAGYWFDPQHGKGIEVSFFALQDASTGFATDSNAHAILAQPFFNAQTNAPNAAFVAYPGLVSGSIAVNETSRLLGAGALYRQDAGTWNGQRLNALIGYRYLHAQDKLSIPVALNAIGLGTFTVTDAFKATSNFHGVDLGIAGEWKQDRWTVEWRGTLALGVNLNSAAIGGTTTTNVGGVVTTSPGGLLALSSNIGNHSQTRFSAVPEIAVKVGYQLAPQWRIFAGYNAMYWTEVQRAGGLIDLTINPSLIPPAAAPVGPQRPQPLFNTSPLLAQGFSFGVRYNY